MHFQYMFRFACWTKASLQSTRELRGVYHKNAVAMMQTKQLLVSRPLAEARVRSSRKKTPLLPSFSRPWRSTSDSTTADLERRPRMSHRKTRPRPSGARSFGHFDQRSKNRKLMILGASMHPSVPRSCKCCESLHASERALPNTSKSPIREGLGTQISQGMPRSSRNLSKLTSSAGCGA